MNSCCPATTRHTSILSDNNNYESECVYVFDALAGPRRFYFELISFGKCFKLNKNEDECQRGREHGHGQHVEVLVLVFVLISFIPLKDNQGIEAATQ